MKAQHCLGFSALLLSALVPASPWLIQRLFWYAHQPPSGQTIHVPKFPPDIHDNLVRGTPTNSFITDRRMDFLEKDFIHAPGDVWIVTYQKVGTTWTQYIVSLLLGHPEVGDLFSLFDHCPWPEVDFGIISTPTNILQQSAATAAGPRCFKSHWPRKGFFTSLPETSKVIYVFRDAESVAVSYLNHIFNWFALYWLREAEITWDQYFEKWFNGDLQNAGYFEHVASWWEAQNNANIMFLRYEELRANTTDSIRRIAAFIGAPLDNAKLAMVLKATSKDSMRKWNEGWMDWFLIKMGVMLGNHVRKDGETSKVSCTDMQRKKMVEKYEALLEPLGMPMEYMFKKAP